MKRITLALLLTTLLAGNAMAADSATLDVTAEVVPTCRFDTNGSLDFGTLDALNPVDLLGVAAAVNPTFTCTNGVNYTITDDSAANPLDNGTDTIVYSLNYVAAGVATGAVQPLAITGDLLAANYLNKSVGVYNATVTLDILP